MYKYLPLLLLAGCSTLLDGPKVDGWPALAITEHRVTFGEAVSRCQQWAQWWEWPTFACSRFDLISKTAEIWCPSDYWCSVERRYMEGYGHPSDVQSNAVAAMKTQ